MQYPDDQRGRERPGERGGRPCADGDEAKEEEAASDADDDVDAGSDADEAKQKEAISDADEVKQDEAGSDTDADVEAGSDADVEADAPAAGSDADGDLDVQEQEDEADVRAAGTDATDADEEVDADPADNRRAMLVVAASLLLAAIVTVTATIYAPPPPVTPSAHRQGLMPITFPTGDLTFSTIHNFPRGGTAIANDNNKKWSDYNPSSVNFQVGVGPGDDDNLLQLSALIRRFLSVVFTSFLHMFYFWHLFGVLDLVLLPLVWVLMGIILYHG